MSADLSTIAEKLASARDSLVDALVDELSAVPGYAGVVTADSQREGMRAASAFLLESFESVLTGGYSAKLHQAYVSDASRERVKWGVPARAVLYTYQISSRLMWDYLRSIVADDEDPIVTLSKCWSLWMEHVDYSTRVVLEAYSRDTVEHILSLSARRWRFAVSMMQDELDQAELRERLRDVGFGRSTQFMLIVARFTSRTSAADMETDILAYERSLRSLTNGLGIAGHSDGTNLYILLPADTCSPEEAGAALRSSSVSARYSCLVSGVQTWEAGAQQLVAALLPMLPLVRAGHVRLADSFSVLDRAIGELRFAIKNQQEPGLDSRLVALVTSDDMWARTIEALWKCGMRVREAATTLHVHPNTVYYRVEQAKKQFGCDLLDLASLVDAYIAMEALRDNA
jgi:hypothetical protein